MLVPKASPFNETKGSYFLIYFYSSTYTHYSSTDLIRIFTKKNHFINFKNIGKGPNRTLNSFFPSNFTQTAQHDNLEIVQCEFRCFTSIKHLKVWKYKPYQVWIKKNGNGKVIKTCLILIIITKTTRRHVRSETQTHSGPETNRYSERSKYCTHNNLVHQNDLHNLLLRHISKYLECIFDRHN